MYSITDAFVNVIESIQTRPAGHLGILYSRNASSVLPFDYIALMN